MSGSRQFIARGDSQSSVPLLHNIMDMDKGMDNADATVEQGRRAAALDDDEMHSLSLYEKKSILINRELDSMGMGRYQWQIWALCGFGYMLDLLWAQAFGLVLSPIQQEFGFGLNETGNISTAFSAGLTAGALFWGALSDIIGRRWAFNLTCLISSIFGLCLGASNNYTTFLVLTSLVGVGVGGNIPIDTTITLEFLPKNKRFLLAVLSIFQPIGVVICSAIAFGFIPPMSCSPNFSEPGALPSCFAKDLAPGTPCCSRETNMGWRYLLFTLGAITLFVFVLRYFVFNFQESPKYLIYRGQDAEAVKVLHHIAKVNKRPCDLTLAHLEALDHDYDSVGADSGRPSLGAVKELKATWQTKTWRELERFKMLFSSWTMTRLTMLVWLTYIFDFWGFTVAGFYLPRILAIKNGADNASLSFTYGSYIYTYFPGVFGVLLGAVMYRVPSVGRKWSMTISSGLMGASILLFSVVDTVPKNLGMFTMEYFFQSMFNGILYGITPQLFPAPIRGTACGLASFLGRIFGIVSPLIAQNLYGSTAGAGGSGNVNAVLYLAGGMTMGCVITTALLPSQLMESTDERS